MGGAKGSLWECECDLGLNLDGSYMREGVCSSSYAQDYSPCIVLNQD